MLPPWQASSRVGDLRTQGGEKLRHPRWMGWPGGGGDQIAIGLSSIDVDLGIGTSGSSQPRCASRIATIKNFTFFIRKLL